jgi:hypothetical protein
MSRNRSVKLLREEIAKTNEKDLTKPMYGLWVKRRNREEDTDEVVFPL